MLFRPSGAVFARFSAVPLENCSLRGEVMPYCMAVGCGWSAEMFR